MDAGVNELWTAGDEAAWRRELAHYWTLVKASLLDLYEEMERRRPAAVAAMTGDEWCTFLRDTYFRWKNTAANRLATTREHLARHIEHDCVAGLDRIRRAILEPPELRVGERIGIAMQIGGLGPAGASGLLALLYPGEFGTVDQFVVKALCSVEDLPEREVPLAMNPESLSLSDAILLVLILRRQQPT